MTDLEAALAREDERNHGRNVEDAVRLGDRLLIRDAYEHLKDENVNLRSALTEALDMVVDACRDGTYSLSEFEHLKALTNG